MKHDMDKLNLRSAFGPEPEDCHAALMAAARSVKEEKKTMRQGVRTLAMAAILVLCMTAVAFAAGQAGLREWLEQFMGVTPPQTAQQVLTATEKTTYEVGPLTMTVSETLADGRLAYLTVNAASKNNALVYDASGDPYDPVGTERANALNDPDIQAETPLALAAQKSGLPLYSVMAWLQLEEGLSDGTEMMDALCQEDGSVLLIDMLTTNPDMVGETLHVDIYLRVKQLDPVTMETIGDAWQTVEQRSLTVYGVTDTRDYQPQGDGALNDGVTIIGAKAELTCAGAYVTIQARLADDLTYSDAEGAGLLYTELLDGAGNAFPEGISLSGAVTLVESGLVQIEQMIGVDTLPESITITAPLVDGKNVTVQ